MSNNTTTMPFCNRGRLRKLPSGGPAHRVRKGPNVGNVIETTSSSENRKFLGGGPTIARVVNAPAPSFLVLGESVGFGETTSGHVLRGWPARSRFFLTHNTVGENSQRDEWQFTTTLASRPSVSSPGHGV
jgi:hypothetical protein